MYLEFKHKQNIHISSVSVLSQINMYSIHFLYIFDTFNLALAYMFLGWTPVNHSMWDSLMTGLDMTLN